MKTNNLIYKKIIVPAKYHGTITCRVIHVKHDIIYCKDKFGNTYEFDIDDIITVL